MVHILIFSWERSQNCTSSMQSTNIGACCVESTKKISCSSPLPYFTRTVSTYLLKTTVSSTVQSILGASPIVKQRLKISRFHKHLCCVRWKSCPKTIAPSVKPLTFFGIWSWSLSGPKKQSLHSSWNRCRNLFTENVAKMLKIYLNYCASLPLPAPSPTHNFFQSTQFFSIFCFLFCFVNSS